MIAQYYQNNAKSQQETSNFARELFWFIDVLHRQRVPVNPFHGVATTSLRWPSFYGSKRSRLEGNGLGIPFEGFILALLLHRYTGYAARAISGMG